MNVSQDALRIVKLEAANVKRLVAVEIKPDGSLVVVGGKNGAGKTSVLDSIAYALGGREALCEEPLRKGAKRGHVSVDLGEFRVKRTFTPEGGGSLTVESKEGAVFRSPQAMLDRLMGRLSFDPLAFARMEPKAQRETLRALVGLDFSALDAARAQKFAERTDANREVKQLEARLAAMPVHGDAPAEPVSVTALMGELAEAEKAHRGVDALEQGARDAERASEDASRAVTRLDAQIADLKRQRDQQAERAVAEAASASDLRERAKSYRESAPDPAPIRQRIAEAEGVNAKVRANADRARLARDLADVRSHADTLSEAIETLDADKAAQLASAKFPVDGLAFDEAGVRLGGVPFSQASAAEQLRVSVAMGLAMNPKLRVLLIRDGSLLDDDSLALVAQMAAAADAQVWMERVGNGAECSVVIEDGHVRGAAPAAEAAA